MLRFHGRWDISGAGEQSERSVPGCWSGRDRQGRWWVTRCSITQPVLHWIPVVTRKSNSLTRDHCIFRLGWFNRELQSFTFVISKIGSSFIQDCTKFSVQGLTGISRSVKSFKNDLFESIQTWIFSQNWRFPFRSLNIEYCPMFYSCKYQFSVFNSE